MRYLHSKLLLVSVSVAALLSGVVALIVFTVVSTSAPPAPLMTTVNIGANLGGMKVASFRPTLTKEEAIEKALQHLTRGNAKARAIFDTLSFDATIATYSGNNAYGRKWGIQDVKVWVVVVHDYPQDPPSGGPAFASKGLQIGEPWNPEFATITTLLADEAVGPDEAGATYEVGDYVWGVMSWWRPPPGFEHMKWDIFAP